MSASSCVETAAGRVVVITNVILEPQVTEQPKSAEKNKFSIQLVALGTVQILVGLMDFGFGIALLPTDALMTITGVFIWEAVSSITAGSLAVAAGTSLKHILVCSTVSVSFTAAVSSAGAAIIHTLDVFRNWTPDYSQIYMQDKVSVMLASFSLLGFVASIYIFVISCRAFWTRPSTDQPLVITNQSNEAASQTSVPTLTHEEPSTYEAPPTSDNSYETMRPPEYSTVIL